MAVDVFELEKQIRKSGLLKKDVAIALGISNTAFFNKMRGEREFKASEIVKLTNVLDLTTSERDAIFFNQ